MVIIDCVYLALGPRLSTVGPIRVQVLRPSTISPLLYPCCRYLPRLRRAEVFVMSLVKDSLFGKRFNGTKRTQELRQSRLQEIRWIFTFEDMIIQKDFSCHICQTHYIYTLSRIGFLNYIYPGGCFKTHAG